METKILKNIPVFSGLSLEEIKGILEFSGKRRYPRGSIVLYRGDEGSAIYVILKGKVKVVLTGEKGKEIILSTLGSGDYFGEMSVFDRLPRSATIVTEEESEFLTISRQALMDQIKKNPQIALKLLSEMSKRLRETDEQISSLAFFDVKGRVARTLLNLSKKPDVTKGRNYQVIPRPASKDIAAMSGTSRETVSRVLSELSKEGLISLTKENIVIYEKLESSNHFD